MKKIELLALKTARNHVSEAFKDYRKVMDCIDKSELSSDEINASSISRVREILEALIEDNK